MPALTGNTSIRMVFAPPRRVVGHYGMGMTTAASPATEQLETLRGLVRTATQRLLGDTILVSDEEVAGAQPTSGLDSRPCRYPRCSERRCRPPTVRVGAYWRTSGHVPLA